MINSGVCSGDETAKDAVGYCYDRIQGKEGHRRCAASWATSPCQTSSSTGRVPVYGRGWQVRDDQDERGGSGGVLEAPLAGGRQRLADEGQKGAEGGVLDQGLARRVQAEQDRRSEERRV